MQEARKQESERDDGLATCPSAWAGGGPDKVRLPRSFHEASAQLPRISGPKQVQNNISKLFRLHLSQLFMMIVLIEIIFRGPSAIGRSTFASASASAGFRRRGFHFRGHNLVSSPYNSFTWRFLTLLTWQFAEMQIISMFVQGREVLRAC